MPRQLSGNFKQCNYGLFLMELWEHLNTWLAWMRLKCSEWHVHTICRGTDLEKLLEILIFSSYPTFNFISKKISVELISIFAPLLRSQIICCVQSTNYILVAHQVFSSFAKENTWKKLINYLFFTWRRKNARLTVIY